MNVSDATNVKSATKHANYVHYETLLPPSHDDTSHDGRDAELLNFELLRIARRRRKFRMRKYVRTYTYVKEWTIPRL